MAVKRIYLCHPNSLQNPLMAEWLGEVQGVISTDPMWSGWSITTWEYDRNCSVSIRDIAGSVENALGPIVLLRNVQERVLLDLRRRFADRTSVLVGDPRDSLDLLNILAEARDGHIVGPMLPRKLVVALLLVAKLERHNMWGGRNKGYMWASDLGKGRGVSEELTDQLPSVVNDLYSDGLLIQKRSAGKKKFALNPDRRVDVHDVIRTRRFSGRMHRIFTRDPRLASARLLDTLDQQ